MLQLIPHAIYMIPLTLAHHQFNKDWSISADSSISGGFYDKGKEGA